MNRSDPYRLVDALPDDVVDEVGRRLAEESGRLVVEALGAPGNPGRARAVSTKSSSEATVEPRTRWSGDVVAAVDAASARGLDWDGGLSPLIGPDGKRMPISMCLSREEGHQANEGPDLRRPRRGKPCIRGTRIMVRNILGMIAGGYTVERVLAEYPGLTREDVAAALEYASLVVDEEKVILPD